MGYLVLARKYRPQTFAEMAGQEHVVRTLANALSAGQLAHAFLFTGPRGVGKTTAARLLAKAVNCERGPTPSPCGRCPACVEIAEGRSVDVVEIDAASNTGVDNVRDIVDSVKYRPARDRYKVFVVDEVHMLSQGAFNALLKTLEEPPGHVVFVLATTDVHRVPETILSRCQRFDFRRLSLSQIVEQLRKVVQAEGMKVSDGSLALLARAAEGGMRDALSLLDRVRAAVGESPDDAAVAEAVGAVDAAAVGRVAWALLRRDGAGLLAELAALHERGQEMRRVAEEVVRRLRDLTVARLAPGVALDLADAERAEVEAQAAAADPAQLARLFDVVQRAVAEVKLSDQPRYTLEVSLLKAALLAPGAEVAELIARVEALADEPSPSGKGQPSPSGRGRSESTGTAEGEGVRPSATSSQPSPSGRGHSEPTGTTEGEGVRPSATLTDDPALPLGDRWRAAVAEVERASPAVAPQLKQGALLRLAEGEVVLQFADGTSFPASVERKRADIEAALGRFFGRPTRLVLKVGPAAPAAAEVPATSLAAVEQAEREARSSRLAEAARGHPNVQEAARVLGADVAKVEEL
ncbi:MAG TPA: DNA polymerase III subunit gamma/tau [Anaeromyxobacteraceae bacterium]|nr:DNA polymerase III subunit gamma/tau [Anaeromyxobacteraceae bacterium]